MANEIVIYSITNKDIAHSLTDSKVSSVYTVPHLSVISDTISSLTADVPVDTGKFISKIKQTNGKISVDVRDFTVADISNVAIISSDFTQQNHRIRFTYNSGVLRLGLFGTDISNDLSIDCADFIKDRMLSTVVKGTDADGKHPYLIFWWNIADEQGTLSTKINLDDILSGFYTGDGDIIKINKNLVVSADVDSIKSKVSYPRILKKNVGNITDVAQLSSQRFVGYLSSLTNDTKILNGTFIPVDFGGSSEVVSTTDTPPLSLGNGDIVIIYSNGDTEYVNLDNTFSLTSNVYVIKAGVSKYEYDKDLKFSLTICSDVDVAPSIGPAVKRNGDVLVLSNEISTASSGTGKYNITGYTWSSEVSNWVAMNGNYYADNIYLNDNLTCAGSYTNVGNIKLSSQNQVLNVKGRNLYEFLTDVFDTTVQPTDGSQPAIDEVKLTNSPLAVEVGTIITPTVKVSFKPGTYNYSWRSNPVENDGTAPSAYYVCNKNDTLQYVSSYTTSTSYTGSLPQISVDDNTNYSISARVEYKEGVVAKDNKGNPSIPAIKHLGGVLNKTAASANKITGYRKSFYYTGGKPDWGDEPLTGFHPSNFSSDYIRGGTASTTAADLSADITVPAGTMFIWYAVPGTKDLIEVIDEKGQGLDVKANFIQINDKVHRLFNVPVYGVGNILSTDYTVFYNLSESSDGFTETILHFKTKNFTN